MKLWQVLVLVRGERIQLQMEQRLTLRRRPLSLESSAPRDEVVRFMQAANDRANERDAALRERDRLAAELAAFQGPAASHPASREG